MIEDTLKEIVDEARSYKLGKCSICMLSLKGDAAEKTQAVVTAFRISAKDPRPESEISAEYANGFIKDLTKGLKVPDAKKLILQAHEDILAFLGTTPYTTATLRKELLAQKITTMGVAWIYPITDEEYMALAILIPEDNFHDRVAHISDKRCTIPDSRRH